MPRRGPTRSIQAEDHLAARIEFERQERGWSPAGLASRLTQVGCPMTQSSIWKIENGEPRRRITLDEAVAFAQVFDVELRDLLLPPEIAASKEALRLWAEHQRATRRFLVEREKLEEIEEQLVSLVDSAARDAVLESLSAQYGEDAGEYVETARVLRDARELHAQHQEGD